MGGLKIKVLGWGSGDISSIRMVCTRKLGHCCARFYYAFVRDVDYIIMHVGVNMCGSTHGHGCMVDG